MFTFHHYQDISLDLRDLMKAAEYNQNQIQKRRKLIGKRKKNRVTNRCRIILLF